MLRDCIICGRKSGEAVTLFSFPTNEKKKKQWATFCKIKCDDLKTNDRLCSLHFDPSAFKISVAKTGRRLKLKPGVAPTVFKPVEKYVSGPTQTYKKQTSGSKEKKLYLYCCLCGVLNLKVTRFSFPVHDPVTTEKWLNVCGFEKQDLNVNLHRVCIQHFSHDDFLKRTNDKQRLLLKPGAVPSITSNQKENTSFEHENVDEPHEPSIERSEGETPRYKKRNPTPSETKESLASTPITPVAIFKGKYPRYIKDIKTEDCGRSKIAKIILEIARRDLIRCKRRSKMLLQRNMRLQKELNAMQETIKQLEAQNFVSEHSFSDIYITGL